MKWSSISFRKRMLIIMTLSGLIELLILVAAGFIYIKQAQEDEMGHQALGVASFLAKSPYVISAIENGVDQESQQRYRSLTNLIGAAFIVIGDKDGIRLVHPLDERIGKPMKGGDNDRALVGGEAYISVAEGSLGYSVRGKTAVFNEQGEIIGVVSVGYLIDRLQDRIEPFIIFLVLMAFIVVGANAIVSSYASRRFQKAILGFEPEEIGRLYVELDVTLETLKEGIITIDDQGKLRSINRSACQILNLNKEQSINRPLSEILPESDLHTVIQTARTDHDINLYLNKQRLIANRSPIIVDGKVVGAVSSFRRRDDLTELTEQLAKTKEYAEMLRSQTHEHRNKLNTISGMVQMGELEAVQYLIGQETAHYQALIEFLRETIKEPLIAGMLLGKTERARELGLQLVVEEGSRLEPLPQRINPEDLVTILGNLIDNAFDATRDAITRDPLFPADRRLVEVSISDYGNEVILEVVDQGCGLPDNVSVDSLVERGVSSKDSSTRGVGLFLTNQLATRYHGELEMMNNKDCGARMTVYLPKDEQI
ncbi:sensor histidine kinase [Vibrio europaeus]|uniref:histidine kinase n=2 Tax=Vibrio oreintalis group TaxID=1891919 RepID=F9T6M2_9VIBR|nr:MULTISPECIES: sensor histidine kinase [Vibrio oreintalis group]AIW14186.1 histidine kinase [Vibrio tubiashii ATCC 19109]EGU54565.1 sensor kinase CitA [Vibrio tubiashii ATCC 19109]EIF02862.1 sensor kinase CitA [Vibrio tubiashii NCIMB 1337 = ATCC 19106]MCG9582458.1 sensor histidine kinase [Vibrio tubiashii]MCG9616049.1 sensor histidine kinase [Vibrio tubiashii]